MLSNSREPATLGDRAHALGADQGDAAASRSRELANTDANEGSRQRAEGGEGHLQCHPGAESSEVDATALSNSRVPYGLRDKARALGAVQNYDAASSGRDLAPPSAPDSSHQHADDGESRSQRSPGSELSGTAKAALSNSREPATLGDRERALGADQGDTAASHSQEPATSDANDGSHQRAEGGEGRLQRQPRAETSEEAQPELSNSRVSYEVRDRASALGTDQNDATASSGRELAPPSAPDSSHQCAMHDLNGDATPSSLDPTLPPNVTIDPADVTDIPGQPLKMPLPTVDAVRTEQTADSFSREIISYLSTSKQHEWLLENAPENGHERFKKKASQFRLIDDLLCYMDPTSSDDASEFQAGGKPRVYVPLSMRQSFMHAYHTASNHAGIARTYALMIARVWWPRMRRDVRRFCRACHVCARAKVAQIHAGEYHRVEDGHFPWHCITVDLYEYQEVDGYDHVLVIADGFTRGVEMVAFKGVPTSTQVLDSIFHRVIRGHRTTPGYIRSDAGSIFISEVCQEFWRAYGTKLAHSTAEHHSTAGLAERANATLHEFLIQHRLSGGDDKWYKYLGHIENAFNALVNATTGFSPTYIEFGRDTRLPLDVAFYGLHSNHGCVKDYVREHLTHLHEVWDIVRTRLGLNALTQKQRADARRDTTLTFEVHDRVLLRKAPGHAKWEEPYHGPYRIAEVLEHDNYRLRDLTSRRLQEEVHVDRLVPYPSITNHGDGSLTDNEYYIQRIVGRRVSPQGEGYEYKVRWRAGKPKDDSWLSLEELANCHDLVREYNVHVNPLHDPPPAPAVEASINDTPLPPGPSPHKPTFRSHPVREAVNVPAEQTVEQSADSAAREDHVLQPAVAADSLVFQAKGVLEVRRKGRGHEALIQWHNTWVPLNAIESTHHTAAIERLRGLYDSSELPSPSTIAPATHVHADVASVIDVRLGPNRRPEAYVEWLPAWQAFSSLTAALRDDARQMLVATSGGNDSSTANRALTEHNAAALIQRAWRQQHAAQHNTWFAPASFNRPDDPLAVRRADTGYLFLYKDDDMPLWMSDDALTSAQRRCCRALLKALALPRY